MLRAGDLRENGIEVVATADKGGAGHVSLPALDAKNRRTPEATGMMALLARKLTLRAEGPFRAPEPEGGSGC